MPAPLLTTDRVRLRFDVDQKSAPQNVLTSSTPVVWASSSLRFELGAFFNGQVVDVSNWESLTIQIKNTSAQGGAPAPADTPLASKTITAFDNTVDATSWGDLSKQHGIVTFTDEEMAFDVSNANKWLVATVTTAAGAVITLGAGAITVQEDGYNSGGSAPVVDETAWSKSQADARYARLAPTGGAYRVKDGVYLQVKNATTGQFHTLFATGAAGAEVLTIGPGEA